MKRGTLIIIIAGVVLIIVLVILALVFSSKPNKTNGNSSSNITLTIWSPFNESSVYQQVSANYLQQNPNLKINFQYIPSTSEADYEATVTNAIASGSGPDIILMRNTWLPKHATQLSPADDSVTWANNGSQSDGAYVAQTYLNTALVAQNSLNGKLYGLPLSVDSLALYVNSNVINSQLQAFNQDNDSTDSQTLRTVPQTWSQLAKWSQLLTKKNSSGGITQSGLAIGTAANTYDADDVYLAMLYQDGGSLFKSDDKTVNLNLSNPNNATDFPAQDALSLYTSFSTPGNPNYSWNESMGDPVQAFISGKAAMMIGDAALSSQIVQDTSNNANFVTIYPLPQPEEIVLPTQSRVDLADYWTQVVSKNSPNKVAAWNYMEYLLQQSNSYGHLTQKPSARDANGNGLSNQTASDGIGSDDIFAQQTATAADVYMVEWQQDEQALTAMINQIVESGQTVNTAVDSAATALAPGAP